MSATTSDIRAPRKLVLAASTGGHLVELVRQLPFLGASDDSLFITFRTPQSESLLAGRRVLYVPYVRPRDYAGVLRAIGIVNRALAAERFDGAVSTGAAIALSVLPIARMRGIPATYIESVCRVDGPSTTGRVLSAMPTVALRTQHEAWADRRWRMQPSVLSTYASAPREFPTDPNRLFVTLGTIEGYRFDSVVDAVLASGAANDDTVWQLGSTGSRRDLPGRVFEQIAPHEFEQYSREAGVVVTHAGVGTLIGLLGNGIYPVMVPRRAHRHEHVDDHQLQIADLVNRLGIGNAVEVDQLDADALRRAAERRIVDYAMPPTTADEKDLEPA
ncbi:UDP-N-acetylglucosamine transferase subunit ALG13 [Agromyces terreus]|uniref:UDP-N-acetylglucosamine transferase subunit ALG13 n=1 Tax=Agromyces terreus TaxID=424795 RepID=A0A9X2GUV7_9MICO|nr:glycosyltransferase [Agromyces terreus]MCP2369450.1 UDP-N-acetylglucosamine transferase subunit ALG13 [Agromyces terreus]